MTGFDARRLRGRAGSVTLNPDALVVGFARPFATYKQAILLPTAPERLCRISTGPPARLHNHSGADWVVYTGTHDKDTTARCWISTSPEVRSFARYYLDKE
jgi:glucan phosphorylase